MTGIDDITDVIDGDTDANEGTDPDQGTDPAVNVPPTVTINAPGDNALLSGTEPIVFVATIEDDNGLDDIATIEWSTDGGATETSQAGRDGRTQVALPLLSGAHVVTVTVVDVDGASAEDDVRVDILPDDVSAAISTPTTLQEFTINTPIDLSGMVWDSDGDVTSLIAEWKADLIGSQLVVDLGTSVVASNGITETEWFGTAFAGDWTLRLTATDELDNRGIAEVTIRLIDPDLIDADADGVSVLNGDCNDDDASINPDALETCGDGIDNDCNHLVDDKDDDLDDFIDADCAQDYDGPLPATDCNDDDASINPDATDVPDANT
ncbi:MAG: hypothetical protein ACJARS_002005, partial [bacterium]